MGSSSAVAAESGSSWMIPPTTTTTRTKAMTATTEGRSRTTTTTTTTKNGSRTATTRAKSGLTTAAAGSNGHQYPSRTSPAATTPVSALRSAALDLSTVERRGQSTAGRDVPKRIRPYSLQEAPTFRPTEEEFRNPIKFIERIAPEGKKYGLVKIIPPDSWNPKFSIDTERFHFRTRRQELNSVEGGTRVNLNYLDQLHKFHSQLGNNLNRFPSVDKRPLDLYKLKTAVEVRGGFDNVCKHKKWAEIGRDLGYSGKIMSSLSTSLKNSYQRWLHPYEEYLRVAKPGVQMQLEHEYGGPLTPSPAPSPMRRSQANTPGSGHDSTPAMRASVALNTSLHEGGGGGGGETDDALRPLPLEAPRPLHPADFAPVNASGFTAVNSRPSPFTPVNGPNGARRRADDEWMSRTSAERPLGSSKNTPEYPCLAAGKSTNLPSSSRMKRKFSQDSLDTNGAKDGGGGVENGDSGEPGGRRSKRLKKETPHTVAGSHMTLLRPQTPRVPGETGVEKKGEKCEGCGRAEDPAALLICDSCNEGYHRQCLDPPMTVAPDYDWHCPRCLVGTGEYGFEEGGTYSLRQFQEKAQTFKENYFHPKMHFDPVHNCKRAVTEDDVEREFWRLVENVTETVEVEYGADIHSTTHGSGFPTSERNRLDPYSVHPWNLNVLPYQQDSLFRHIETDISGMTVPWLYVGMCFSTFCWHNEDHYCYSANYQHFGATKTWYGIPAEDAEKFERAMKEAVPDLFEKQPDLLFQLVTLLPPDKLKKAGVRVYALDQRAGQFVITFPQAYHAGFNHGFNFNEAVNFAPRDWEPFGADGVLRLQEFRRPPCFSHDELLLSAAAHDHSIGTAQWLSVAISRLREREEAHRRSFKRNHEQSYGHRCEMDSDDRTDECGCPIEFSMAADKVPEEESHCFVCKAYVYLSCFICHRSSKTLCLLHAGTYACCDATEPERFAGYDHTLKYRKSDRELAQLDQRLRDRAMEPKAWADKLNGLLENDARPPLKALRSLVSEGDRIAYELPQLPPLKAFVDRCNDWVERAMNYIVRKQQNRRKNEKAWRKGNSVKAAEMEERDRELRRIDNVLRLLTEADELGFGCAEITQLQGRAEDIQAFQQEARAVLQKPASRTTQEIEELVDRGKGFNVDIPEVEQLDRVVQQMKWKDQAQERRRQYLTIQDIDEMIEQAENLGMPAHNELLVHFKEQRKRGELWEAKAQELISAEAVHFPQLEALAGQASSLPVSRETLAAVEQILNKQREAHRHVVSMFEKSKHPNLRERPKYKEVKHLMETLADLNSKPAGTLDLEREQKRHEDWMRKGKKLFGKANAPLHILLMHMQHVQLRNQACFNTKDVPRAPAEPSSREHTPGEAESSSPLDGPGRERDVFCICRLPESGMMIECELCHEWYHGKCLKIARGKVKEDDKYTCPICDWRIKIPRDAARPKLEDLQEWQAEIPQLPFQADEEECLNRIVRTAQAFRDFVRPYISSFLTTPEELPTQRFWLRKIEGADILLADETNFFRAELHRWAPVAPEPPPMLEQSLSTRKPRPTKQQKLMAQLGIDNPDDLPQDLRTKTHNFNRRKSSDPKHGSSQPPLSAGGISGNHTSGFGGFGSHPPILPAPPTSVEPRSTFAYDAGSPSAHLPGSEYMSTARSMIGSSTSPPPTLAPAASSSALPLAPHESPFRHHARARSEYDPNPTLLNGSHYSRDSNHHHGAMRASLSIGGGRGSPGAAPYGVGAAEDMHDDDGQGGDGGNVDSIFADLTNHDDAVVDGMGSPPPPQPSPPSHRGAEREDEEGEQRGHSMHHNRNGSKQEDANGPASSVALAAAALAVSEATTNNHHHEQQKQQQDHERHGQVHEHHHHQRYHQHHN